MNLQVEATKKVKFKLWPLLLTASWICVHTILLARKGIVTDFEAGKYIGQAHLLLETGDLSYKNLWFYSLQIFILLAAIKAHIGFIPVYLFQLLLNGASTIYFFRLCEQKSNTQAAYFATILLIFNFPLQEFTCYLQTESIFISLIILFTYYLNSISVFHLKQAFLLLIFIFILCITRPNGLMFIASTFLFLYFKLLRQKPAIIKITVIIAIMLCFYWIINFALGSGGEWRFMLAFQKEIVLCADSPYFTEIKMSKNPHSIEGFAFYISHNWLQFLRLSFFKIVAFFSLYRSHFSTLHNFYNMAYTYPIYLGVVYSIKPWIKKDKYFWVYLTSYILLALLTVVLTCDDVHNRFFLILCPYLYLLSLPALHFCLQKRQSN